MPAHHEILLSPLDQLMPPSYTRIFLSFPISNPSEAIEAFKHGIEDTCSQLPFLKGYVSLPANQKGFVISWSDDLPTPVLQETHAPEDSPTYAELKAQGMPFPYFEVRLSPVGIVPDHSSPENKAPVIAVGFTKLAGGLLLCIGVNHNVMDGTGVGELITILAHNTKRYSGTSTTAFLTLPDPAEPLTRTQRLKNAVLSKDNTSRADNISLGALLKSHPEYHLPAPPDSQTASSKPALVFPACDPRIYNFSTSKLRAVKKELCSLVPGSRAFTVNNILTAVIWSRISCARFIRVEQLKKEQKQNSLPPTYETYTPFTRSRLGMAVNGRTRLDATAFASIPYLGNTNLYSLTDLAITDLISDTAATTNSAPPLSYPANLSNLITQISKSISVITPSHIAEVISLVEKLPDARALQPGWDFLSGPDLGITSWANLGVYEADFGFKEDGVACGLTEFVRVPYIRFDGLVIILPRKGGRDGDAGIEVVAYLRQDDLEYLETQDEIWREWAM